MKLLPHSLRLTTIVSAPFQENTYIASLKDASDCLIIDPGLEPAKIVRALEREKLSPAAILITHGHSDHIAGNEYLKQRWRDCPIVTGRHDAAKLTSAKLNLSADFGFPIVSPPADVLLDEGDRYEAAGLHLDILAIPGHSSGHIVFVWRDNPSVVFGGDVLFAGSIGRTDFPDGSFEQLASGIWSKLFTLPDDTIVLPGHGESTTIGEEKRTNPFVGAPAGYRA